MSLLRALTRIAAFVSLAAANALHAQTIDDGIMLNKHNIFAGFVYTTSSWEHYWEEFVLSRQRKSWHGYHTDEKHLRGLRRYQPPKHYCQHSVCGNRCQPGRSCRPERMAGYDAWGEIQLLR